MEKCKIFCFGDSITYGVGDNVMNGYVDRLRSYYNVVGDKYKYYDIYNLGINANTSYHLVNRIRSEIFNRLYDDLQVDKYIAVICIGANDVAQGYSLMEFEYNLIKIINDCKYLLGNECSIALVGLPFMYKDFMKHEDASLYETTIKDVANYCGVTYISNPVVEDDLSSDILHPNGKGYDKMFEVIKDFIEKVK